jgi:outer membrane protein assembly factor BamE (lipoprotein component of BamABCDE complex)
MLPLLAIPAGCINKTAQQGVANLWRAESAAGFERGVSTQQDVLARLGPPSQLIQIGDRSVFYYLRELRHERGAILLVYNQTRESVTYDRAIFFFDPRGVLSEFALSDEVVPPE